MASRDECSSSQVNSMALEDNEGSLVIKMETKQHDPTEAAVNQSQEPLTNSPLECAEDNYELTFEHLPTEIILHICSFLDAKTVMQTLSKVCRMLQDLFSSDTFWKIRMGKRWPQKYPAIPVNDEEFDWKEACVFREEQHRMWSQPSIAMEHFVFSNGIFASVDSVHLMRNGSLLASGSRDRYLNVLDLTKLEAGNPESIKNTVVHADPKAHKGWIWSMSSLDNVLATGSWDTYVGFWDMAAGCKLKNRVKCKSAVLCTHFEPTHFLAGGYDKKVYHIDPRSSSIVAEKRYHRQPVLCLAADDNYCLTGSEDSTVAIYDRRASSVFKTIKLDAYPMSLSYGQDQLWVGDKAGNVHLFDATDGDFTLVETYEQWHQGKVTGVHHNLGSLITCSTDGTIQVRHPTLEAELINTLNPDGGELAKITFQNNVLACACAKVSVGIWRPKPDDPQL